MKAQPAEKVETAPEPDPKAAEPIDHKTPVPDGMVPMCMAEGLGRKFVKDDPQEIAKAVRKGYFRVQVPGKGSGPVELVDADGYVYACSASDTSEIARLKRLGCVPHQEAKAQRSKA